MTLFFSGEMLALYSALTVEDSRVKGKIVVDITYFLCVSNKSVACISLASALLFLIIILNCVLLPCVCKCVAIFHGILWSPSVSP